MHKPTHSDQKWSIYPTSKKFKPHWFKANPPPGYGSERFPPIMTQKRHSSSFMIDDILGTSVTKTFDHPPNLSSTNPDSCSPTSPTNPSCYCPTPQRYLGSAPFGIQFHPQVVHYGPVHESSSSVAFRPSVQPISVVTPQAVSTSREGLVYFQNAVSSKFLTTRHELLQPMFGTPAVLDLSSCTTKAGTMHHARSSMQNPVVDGNHQIFWKHLPRNPAKRKGGQIRFSNEQTTTLEGTFGEHKYLSSNERKRLAVSLKLTERQVKTWFQNRRAKWRRIKEDPLRPISSPDSNNSEHEDDRTNNQQDCFKRHFHQQPQQPRRTLQC